MLHKVLKLTQVGSSLNVEVKKRGNVGAIENSRKGAKIVHICACKIKVNVRE